MARQLAALSHLGPRRLGPESNENSTAGKRGASEDLYKISYGFFGWCVEQGYLDTNPLVGARRKRSGSRAERLDRAEKGRDLSNQEIVAVWTACERLGSFGLLVRFLLLSGARRSEGAPAQVE